MNVTPYLSSTRVEVSYREHPQMFVARKSLLDGTWPTPHVQQWLQHHGGNWHVENDARLVVNFGTADTAMLFKLTFA